MIVLFYDVVFNFLFSTGSYFYKALFKQWGHIIYPYSKAAVPNKCIWLQGIQWGWIFEELSIGVWFVHSPKATLRTNSRVCSLLARIITRLQDIS